MHELALFFLRPVFALSVVFATSTAAWHASAAEVAALQAADLASLRDSARPSYQDWVEQQHRILQAYLDRIEDLQRQGNKQAADTLLQAVDGRSLADALPTMRRLLGTPVPGEPDPPGTAAAFIATLAQQRQLQRDAVRLRAIATAYQTLLQDEQGIPLERFRGLTYPPSTAAEAMAVTALIFEYLAATYPAYLDPGLFCSSFLARKPELLARPRASIDQPDLRWAQSFACDWSAPLQPEPGRILLGHRAPVRVGMERVCLVAYADGRVEELRAAATGAPLPRYATRNASLLGWDVIATIDGRSDHVYQLERPLARSPENILFGDGPAQDCWLK